MDDAERPVGQRSLEDVRLRAYDLLLQEAADSAGGKDPKRFDALIARLVFDDAGLQENEPTAHELQMDRWRVWTTVAMVAALFLIIVAAILLRQTTASPAVTGFVSLFSGLAGIALGWLFGSGGVNVRRSAPRAQQIRQRKTPSG